MPTSLVKQHTPRISRGVYSGVTVVVNAVKYQRQFSVQEVELQLVLSWVNSSVDLGFYAHFTCATVRSSQFLVASFGLSLWWSVPPPVRVIADLAGRFLLGKGAPPRIVL